MKTIPTANAQTTFLLSSKWGRARAIVSFLFLIFTLSLSAQDRISGVVVDSLTHKPIVKANVMLLKGGKVVTFCRTNDKGEFSLSHSTSNLKELQLQATALEYEKKRIRITAPTGNRIAMAQKVFEMQEITVKAGPITGGKDTITFDLTRFASERDNSLKDVLAKLPGVHVGSDGKISVNGKDISRFTVEGSTLATEGTTNSLKT